MSDTDYKDLSYAELTELIIDLQHQRLNLKIKQQSRDLDQDTQEKLMRIRQKIALIETHRASLEKQANKKTLRLDLGFPETWSEHQIEAAVLELIGKMDQMHASLGGGGLKIDTIEVSTDSITPAGSR